MKPFWTAPPGQPDFYEAVRWLERVEESDHPASKHASAALNALKPAYLHDKDSDDLTDTSLGHKDLIDYALLGLKAQDLSNLHMVRHHMKGARNFGVVIRRLVAREAKQLRGEA